MKKIVLLLVVLLVTPLANAQVGINTTNPEAALDIVSSDSGVLIPRVQLDDALTAAPVTTPVEGMLIYNATGIETQGFYFWDGAEWNLVRKNKSTTWPAFNVYNDDGGNQSTTGIFPATVKLFDQGNNFDLTTDKFTVPVSGIYQFNWSAYSNNFSGRAFLFVNAKKVAQTNGSGKAIAITLSLNKGDKVYITGVTGYALHWYGAKAHNAFSGHLVMPN